MKNQDLRRYAKDRNVRLWQIAPYFGISADRFSVWMRREFSDDQKTKFRSFVDRIVLEREGKK